MEDYLIKPEEHYMKEMSQEELRDIVLNEDECEKVRILALRNLNKDMLKYIIFNVNTINIEIAVLELIDDQNILIEIALSKKDWCTRIAAIEKIENEFILTQLALHDVDLSVRIASINKIHSEVKLKDIVLKSDNFYVAKSALGKIKNTDVIVEIANQSENKDILLLIIQLLPREKLRCIKSKDWYVKRVLADILK